MERFFDFSANSGLVVFDLIMGSLTLLVLLGDALKKRGKNSGTSVGGRFARFASGIILGVLSLSAQWLAFGSPADTLPLAVPSAGVATIGHILCSLLAVGGLGIFWRRYVAKRFSYAIPALALLATAVGWEAQRWPMFALVIGEIVVLVTLFTLLVLALPGGELSAAQTLGVVAFLVFVEGAIGFIVFAHPLDAPWFSLTALYALLVLFDFIVYALLPQKTNADLKSWIFTLPVTLAVTVLGASGVLLRAGFNPYLSTVVWLEVGAAVAAYIVFTRQLTFAQRSIDRVFAESKSPDDAYRRKFDATKNELIAKYDSYDGTWFAGFRQWLSLPGSLSFKLTGERRRQEVQAWAEAEAHKEATVEKQHATEQLNATKRQNLNAAAFPAFIAFLGLLYVYHYLLSGYDVAKFLSNPVGNLLLTLLALATTAAASFTLSRYARANDILAVFSVQSAIVSLGSALLVFFPPNADATYAAAPGLASDPTFWIVAGHGMLQQVLEIMILVQVAFILKLFWQRQRDRAIKAEAGRTAPQPTTTQAATARV